MISVKVIKKPKKVAGTSVSGGSSAYAPKSSTDRVSYADNAGNAEFAARAGNADFAENAGLANYATEAGMAHEVATDADIFNKFLRKDVPDAAAGKLTFNGGTLNTDKADFGTFFSDWLLGTGARIDSDGNAEFKSLKVRESLDVAQLVFNKITARDAEDIISPGRGIVESVRKVNAGQGSITLRLQDNEWATVAAGDICRGIFNNISASSPANWATDGTDGNGFRKKKGFFTSYFRITSVIRNEAGLCQCTYELQSGTTEHPCENMVFCVYGNTSDTTRQNSIYITSLGISPRIVFLAGVSDFAIGPEHYKIALGNIEGIVVIEELADVSEYNANPDPNKFTRTIDGTVHYYAHKTLEGDAGFYCEDNIYLGGVINQFKAAAMATIEASIANVGQAWVSASAESYIVDCDENGNIERDNTFICEFELYYGSHKCQITSVTATYGNTTQTVVPGVNDEWTLNLDFDQGDSLSSGIVSVLVTGTYNGTAYTASKTLSIIANRRGRKGDTGAVVRFLGPWDDSLAPVWDDKFRDCVKHTGTYWLVDVASDGTTPLGEPGTNNNWENIGAMRFVATELLLAEEASIANLVAEKLVTGGEGTPRIHMEGSIADFYGVLPFPNIRLGVIDDPNDPNVGCAVLKFYDKNGNFRYDLGPEGIVKTESTVSEFVSFLMKNIDAEAADKTSTGLTMLKVQDASCSTYYRFIEGYVKQGSSKIYRISASATPSSYNGKSYDSQSMSSTEPDAHPTGTAISGWFLMPNYGRFPTRVVGSTTYFYTAAYHYVLGALMHEVDILFLNEHDWWRDSSGAVRGGLARGTSLLDFLNAQI